MLRLGRGVWVWTFCQNGAQRYRVWRYATYLRGLPLDERCGWIG